MKRHANEGSSYSEDPRSIDEESQRSYFIPYRHAPGNDSFHNTKFTILQQRRAFLRLPDKGLRYMIG